MDVHAWLSVKQQNSSQESCTYHVNQKELVGSPPSVDTRFFVTRDGPDLVEGDFFVGAILRYQPVW